MLRNESVNDWLKLVKTNSTNIMQIIAEKRLNPNNYHLSADAKKRLRWLHLLYYEEKGNVSRAARKIGLSRPWLSHLKQIFENNNRDPRSLEPESKAPNNTSNRNKISEKVEKLIIKIRDDSLNSWGKEKIAWVLERDYKIKVNHNTVNKYLHKHKRIDPKISLKNSRAFEEKKYRESDNILFKVKFRPPKKLKDYAPGALVEKDMKYLKKPKQEYNGKHKDNYWYQFTEADSFTRIRTLEISNEQDTKTTIASHKEAIKRFPFEIACENTDNGFENNNDFSKELKKENVFHFYSNASTPTDNPRVERSHLTDDLEFYLKGNLFNDLQQQKEATKKWEDNYNFKRPHQALGYLTPMEFYLLWKKNPEKACAITEKWQEYLRRQRLRLARARRIKKKEQIVTLMKFIDAKLKHNKQEVEDAKLQLIDCQLCSVA
ncbi:integrase core domain-containing protein [Patescibacteria group bacterium]|nr:integrase core domain-containing protein [Patescibacteria group bacterium]